jgi:hypothetical protein
MSKMAGKATAKAKMGVIPGLRNVTHFQLLTNAMERAIVAIGRANASQAEVILREALEENQQIIEYHRENSSP